MSKMLKKFLRELHDELRDLLLPGEVAPNDGFIPLSRLVPCLIEKMKSERYNEFVEADVLDIIDNHDPLQRFGREVRGDQIYIRVNYRPNLELKVAVLLRGRL